MRHVTSPNQPRPAPRSVIAGLTAGIFLADLAAPADIAVWWFYTVPVYLVALETKKLNPLNFAGLCSALTVADHYLSAPGGSEQSAVLNRSIAMVVFWIEAVALVHRRRADAAQQSSLAMFEAALASMTDAVSISDSAGKFIEFNDAFATFHRFENQAECAQNLADYPAILEVYLDGERVPLNQWAVSRALRGETVTGAEYTLRLKRTGETWIGRFNFSPIRDAAGVIVGAVVVAHDMTQRNQTEAERRSAAARLSVSVTAANIGLWDWNLVSNEVVFSNDWAGLLGYAEGEMPNRLEEWDRLVHPDDLAPTYHAMRTSLATSAADYEAEFRMRHKGGSYRWIYARGQAQRDAHGQPVRLLGWHVDMTERRRAIDELSVSREKLRALRVRLDQIRETARLRISRAIHDDLGQLLTALSMDTSWLERKLSAPGLPAACGEILERAVDARTLVRTALVATQRIAADLRPTALDSLGLAEAISDELPRLQKRAGVICHLEVDERWQNPSLQVARELFNICQEALANVVRHAQATQIAVSLRCDDAVLVLEVADDGVGLPDDALGAVSSLGLTEMQERALQCGATISFSRNAPRGTRVTVRRPPAKEGPTSR